MGDPVQALILDLLESIESGPRPYEEIIDAWRTSCPRLPVWEDANDRNLVELRARSDGRLWVHLTPSGRALLEQAGKSPASPLADSRGSPIRRVAVHKRHFRTKEQAIREIVDAGWWPVSWRDAPGEVYAPHKHDADQTLYLVEGTMDFEGGGSRHRLEPGDKLELPAFTVHAVTVPNGAVYILGMPKVDLLAEHVLAPDA